MSDDDTDKREVRFTKKEYAKLVEFKINDRISAIDVFERHLAITTIADNKGNTTVIHGRLTWWCSRQYPEDEGDVAKRLGIPWEASPWNIV